ncbi:unnamed protein product [Durusdinium trenchii]|uniref:Uncharacterized protein n=1 Tax=Durusdinium trenchii TaxID=1381693 RepID=A0ABP0P3G3_9DINO
MSAAPTPSLQKDANDAPKGVPQDTLNIVLTAILLMLVITGCCWWLAFLPEDSYSCPIGMSDAPVRFYNLTMAVGASSLMIWHYLDPDALKVRYTVLGRPEFPVLHREFLGVQRWSTFTSWSNLSCTMFLCSAAILGFCGPEPPKALCMVNQVFWELTFPLAFFVNIVVSFVLIPQIKKMRDWQKLKRMLRLKPQLLHNGLAIAGAVEAMLATPPMKLSHFPVLVLFWKYVHRFCLVFLSPDRNFPLYVPGQPLQVRAFGPRAFIDPPGRHILCGLSSPQLRCRLLACQACDRGSCSWHVYIRARQSGSGRWQQRLFACILRAHWSHCYRDHGQGVPALPFIAWKSRDFQQSLPQGFEGTPEL